MLGGILDSVSGWFLEERVVVRACLCVCANFAAEMGALGVTVVLDELRAVGVRLEFHGGSELGFLRNWVLVGRLEWEFGIRIGFECEACVSSRG